jgi:hypothetical protein
MTSRPCPISKCAAKGGQLEQVSFEKRGELITRVFRCSKCPAKSLKREGAQNMGPVRR